ncbi:MAG: aminoacyl-tRNA hydrolase [Candidatus Omnitrophica bacterium]|nr:aminoacyl-tRNA hydrolase [Candidatus Omnitrophota bacterium]
MKAIIGLGNPGFKYRHTRHNIGFMVLDRVAKSSRIRLKNKSFGSLWGVGKIGKEEVMLAKPLTYMNLSGKAVSEIVRNKGFSLENLLVIMDDKDLPLGKIRVRKNGTSGGHNGLRSIIEGLGTDEFPRLRIGIGPPKNMLRDYVLTPFGRGERGGLSGAMEISILCVNVWITKGIDAVMNRFNP